MAGVFSIFVVFLLFLLMLALVVVIGVYVYRDSKERGMNSLAWTLLSVLAPGFIGLLLYLVVRAEYAVVNCRSCGKPVEERFANCPYCGTPLKERCNECRFPLEPGWAVCPSCGTEIPEEQRIVHRVELNRNKGKGLGKILALVIAIPVLLCILMILAVFFFKNEKNVVACSSMWVVDMEEYLLEQPDEEVADWLMWCELVDMPGVFVLKAEEEGLWKYLVYRNDGGVFVNPEVMEAGLFKKPIVQFHYITDLSEPVKGRLIYFETDAPGDKKIQILTDGRETEFIEEEIDRISLEEICEEGY